MIFIPIIVNLTIYSLPENTKQNFILKTNDITLLNLYLTHFTHLEWEHLRDNLINYFVFSIFAFLILSSMGEDKKFAEIFLLIFVAVPFIISLFWIIILSLYFLFVYNITILGETKGFSGIVGSILGLLIVSFSYYIYKTTSIRRPFVFSLFILIELLYMPLIYFKRRLLDIIAIILILFLIFFSFFSIMKDAKNKDIRPLFDDLKSSKVKFGIFYLAMVIIILGSVLLFPQNVGNVDLISHYLGLVLGLLLSVLVLR